MYYCQLLLKSNTISWEPYVLNNKNEESGRMLTRQKIVFNLQHWWLGQTIATYKNWTECSELILWYLTTPLILRIKVQHCSNKTNVCILSFYILNYDIELPLKHKLYFQNVALRALLPKGFITYTTNWPSSSLWPMISYVS